MKTEFLKLFNHLELSDFHKSKLKFIDETDFSKVKEKVKKELGGASEEYLDQGIVNLKLYYALPLLDPLNGHAISKELDPFWHFHVLFTKEYISFCNKLLGKYMHHEPLLESDLKERERVKKLYKYTITVNKKLIKSLNSKWWPENEENYLVCSHGNFKPKTKNKILSQVISNSLFEKNIHLS